MYLCNGERNHWSEEQKAHQAKLEIAAAKSLKASQDAVWEKFHKGEAAKEKKLDSTQ